MWKILLKNLKTKIDYLIYSQKEKRHYLVGPAELWKMKQDFQINFFKNKGLKNNHLFLDIGCGTLRGGIPFISYLKPGNYYGIEIRKKVIQEGKKELEEHNLNYKNPHLILFSNFDELDLGVKFDFIFSFSVMIHMKDDIISKCFNFVSRHLKNDGNFYANVSIGEKKDGYWQGFPVIWRKLEFYEKLASMYNLEMENIGKLKELGHHSGYKNQDNQYMLRFSLI